LLPFDLVSVLQAVGYVGLAAIIFAESGLLIGFFLPGDSLLFPAGFLASPASGRVTGAGDQGFFNIWILVPLCFVAAVMGDAVGYTFGHRVGRRLYERKDSRFFKHEHLLRAEEFFERHGGKAIVLARFVPVVRTFTPIVAGMGSMRYPQFALYNFAGAFLWAIGVTLAGYFLGNLIPDIDKYLLPIIGAIILVSIAPTLFELWRNRRH